MDAISFGTDGWRATLDTFTGERVRMVGQAVATYLDETGVEGPVAVGYDARESSPGFADDLADVLAGNGRDVLVPPRDCPTPVVAWTVTDRDLAGALMLTASHNPPEYNGVKFVPADGTPALPDVTDELEAKLAEPELLPERERGEVRETEFVEPYLEHAREFVDADLSGLSVVYDAMHGSGRGVTDELLESCGATVERLRCERDPTFGGTPPEPSPEHLGDLARAVVDGEADLGVANDGDADRLAVVTPTGPVDANRLFVALYDHLLEGDSGDAVRTVSTTFLVDRVAEAHGQSAHETAVGFKWVAEAMGEYDTLMGGEESGGFGITDHLRNKDGVLLALVVAAAHAAEPIQERLRRLLDEHGDVHQDRVSVDCPDERKQAVLAELETRIPDEVAGASVERVNTVDGFKILLADGSWLLVRPSGTEPKLRIYAESSSDRRVKALLAEGEELVEPLV
jgi:phosphomannomutase